MAFIELELIEELFAHAGREDVIGELTEATFFVNKEEDGLYGENLLETTYPEIARSN